MNQAKMFNQPKIHAYVRIMLLSGIDISGKPHIDNYRFMAIVIGTQESIILLYKNTGLYNIHISRLRPNKQKRIIGKPQFDGKDTMAFCIALDREQTIETVENYHRIKKRNLSGHVIHRQYDFLLKSHLKPHLDSFTLNHD